jgi:2-polyprenyl-6-methoxyphenol hydroxylase-like FAD-dependent oxidoreductase
MDADVLIAGAGPTGLMLANQLCRRGVRVLVIERNAGPARETRALGVQARTLEIYAKLGIADRALALGLQATGANLWTDGRRTARVPLGDIGRALSPYPFLLILGQDANERLLGEALQAHGQTVHWNTALSGLTQQADRCIATLKQADGSEHRVEVGWVAGCDGAHSVVRHLNQIAFEGAPYEQVFFVADTAATGDMVPDELNIYLWPHGFHLFFPLRGEDHWRVVGILPAALRDKPGLSFDDVVPSMRAQAGDALKFKTCTWFSPYRIHHRRAQRFHAGRCFLLGDAAHIHSPVGAQGMNTGLQDAYNLAWKLALVVNGQASEPLLDSYTAEREPVAQRLLETTDRAFSQVVSETWLARSFRTRLLPLVVAAAMRIERVRRFAFRTISQIGIKYPESRLSERCGELPGDAPQPGERFPWVHLRFGEQHSREDVFERLDDTRFNLIAIGQEPPAALPAALTGMLAVHTVAAEGDNAVELNRVGLPLRACYLLRPDGHIGLAGARLTGEDIARYARERLHLQAEPTLRPH